jgi:hypothetical protein
VSKFWHLFDLGRAVGAPLDVGGLDRACVVAAKDRDLTIASPV